MAGYLATVIYGYIQGDLRTWDEMQVEVSIATEGDPAGDLGEMTPVELVAIDNEVYEAAMDVLKNVENLAFTHLERASLITEEDDG